jgi:hypothetical protein
MRRRILTFAVLTAMAGLAGVAAAQIVTGNIAGTVKDASGAVMPNATITITSTDKNIVVRTVKTNSKGEYSATFIPVGHYTISAEATGFKRMIQTGVNLDVSESLTVDFAMQVGEAQQSVRVTAPPLQVDLQNAQAQTVITGTQIQELAVNTRNYEQLVMLMPGVSTELESDQLYVGVTSPSGLSNQIDFSINGSRPTQNEWNIDGADNVDRGANLTLLAYPSIDSIDEFSVQRGLYTAEYGRSSSGQVNVITKSGSSQFHGDLYEFWRNDILEANNFFNNAAGINPATGQPFVPRPPLRYNDFGGTIGGPVFIPGHYNTDKKKTFFFFSEEARRVLTYTTFIAAVPTAAELKGTFPTPVCLNPSCSQTGTQVTNIDPAAEAYIKDIFSKIPGPNLVNGAPCVPTAAAPCTLTSTGENTFNFTQEIVRIDQVINPNFTIYGRFENDSIPTQEPGGLFTADPLPGVSTTTTNSPGRAFTVHANNVFGPTLVNDGGFNYSHGAVISNPIGTEATQNSPDITSAVTLPFTSTLNRVPDLDFFFYNSITGFGPYRDYNTNYNAFDNLTKIIGRHTMKFGFTYNWYQKNEDAGSGNNGAFDEFNNVDPTGTPSSLQEFASFLEGNVLLFSQTSQDYRAVIQQQEAEFYAQDQFHVRSNLTLDYGLRYSLFRQPVDANNNLSNFDPALFNSANAEQIDPCTGNLGIQLGTCANPDVVPPTGTAFNGMIFAGKNSPYGDGIAQQGYRNFGPRLGLAWDPFGTGKTSVRTGYGIYYDSPAVGRYESTVFDNPPLVDTDLIRDTTMDNPAAVSPFVGTAPVPLTAIGTAWKYPYTEEWSLDVQREIMPNLLFDIGYYANESHHLLGIVDINQPQAGAYVTALAPYGVTPPVQPGTPTAQLNYIRPFRGYDAINDQETEFNSNYNGLQIVLQKRFSQSSLLNINYTWSHALTNADSDFATPQDQYDLAAEYGPAEFDRRQILNVNYVYYLPFFRTSEGFQRWALGGWEVSGIVSAYTGLPNTVYNFINDPAGQGTVDGNSFASGRLDEVSDPNVPGFVSANPTCIPAPTSVHNISTFWFNPCAFNFVPANEVRPGDSQNGAVRGPGLQRWDLSLFKNFRFAERYNLQFRGEAFNVFNHVNPDAICAGLGEDCVFGTVLSTRDPRVMQLGGKFYF